MRTNQTISVPSVSSVAKSFHHRMARLVPDAYYPRCEARACARAAAFICEWDQLRGIKAVSAHKLYCTTHACSFATKHNIYMAGLPSVRHSQLETAGRDDWKYSDNLTTKGTKVHEDNSVCSVSSVAQTNSEES